MPYPPQGLRAIHPAPQDHRPCTVQVRRLPLRPPPRLAVLCVQRHERCTPGRPPRRARRGAARYRRLVCFQQTRPRGRCLPVLIVKMMAHETPYPTNAARTCAAGEYKRSGACTAVEPVVVLRIRARSSVKGRGLSSQTIGRGSRPVQFICFNLERKPLAGTACQHSDGKRPSGQGPSQAQARQTGACRVDLSRGRA